MALDSLRPFRLLRRLRPLRPFRPLRPPPPEPAMSVAENPQFEPFRLPGPEIPNVDVDENGVFQTPRGDAEVYEKARLEFFSGLGLDDETSIEWLWPERIPLGLVTVIEGAVNLGKSLLMADL